MKKKILFSILGVALFAVAIVSSVNIKQNNLLIQNTEALAKYQVYFEGDYAGSCGSPWTNKCVMGFPGKFSY